MVSFGNPAFRIGRSKGVGFARNTGVPAWVEAGASFDADFGNSRFFYGSREFSSEAGFLTSAGGIEASGLYTFGPYDIPGAADQIVNGDFAAGTTGWTAGATGSIAVSSGELVLTAANANDYYNQQINGLNGKCLRVRGTGRRGTTVSPIYLRGGRDANLANSGGTDFTNSGSNTDLECFVPCYDPTYIGWRNQAAGTSIHDNVSATEVLPFSEWRPGNVTVVIDGTTPTSVVADQTVWQSDNNSERACIRLIYQSDGHLHWKMNNENGQQLNVDLGAISVETPFCVAFHESPGAHLVAIDGGYTYSSTNSNSPGAAFMRLGKNSSGGSVFTGSVDRVTYLPIAPSLAEVATLSARNEVGVLYMDGDSYIAGDEGVSLAISLRAENRICISSAVPGATIYQIRDRLQAEAVRTKKNTVIVWDGSPTGYSSVSEYMAAVADIVAAIPHDRYCLIPPVRRVGQGSGERTDTATIQSQMAALYPDNVYDAQSFLVTLAVSPGDDAAVAAGNIPPSTLQVDDGLHLTSTAMNAVAADLSAWLTAKSW